MFKALTLFLWTISQSLPLLFFLSLYCTSFIAKISELYNCKIVANQPQLYFVKKVPKTAFIISFHSLHCCLKLFLFHSNGLLDLLQTLDVIYCFKFDKGSVFRNFIKLVIQGIMLHMIVCLKIQAYCAGWRRTLPDATPLIRKLLKFSKMAVVLNQ